MAGTERRQHELRRLRRASCPCSAKLHRVWSDYPRMDLIRLGLARCHAKLPLALRVSGKRANRRPRLIHDC